MNLSKPTSSMAAKQNRYRNLLVLTLVGVLAGVLRAEEAVDPDTRKIHDPTMICAGDDAYVYATGPGLKIRRSSDLLEWHNMGSVFTTIPAWIQNKIPGVSGLWAPDIIRHNGKYYVCYSASTFGSQRSLIALISNKTLDPARADYEWVDEGEIIDSPPDSGTHNYNAIDGTFVSDPNGHLWLTFGSYWDGIMLTPLDPATLKPTTSPPTIYPIARRQGTSAIEAAYITCRSGYYYLFVNFDTCCRGVNSTYKIMVGRSRNITGPYLDKNGVSMLSGGGTLFVGSHGRWIGPGHATITEMKGREYFSYHAYDGQAGGIATLRVNKLSWDRDLWPVFGDSVSRSRQAGADAYFDGASLSSSNSRAAELMQ